MAGNAFQTLTYFRKMWRLDSPALLTETRRALLYTVRRADAVPAVLKIYKSGEAGYEDMAQEFLIRMQGEGTVRLYQKAPGATLMEYQSRPAAEANSYTGGATDILIGIAEKLRQRAASNSGLSRAASLFRARVDLDHRQFPELRGAPFDQAFAQARMAFEQEEVDRRIVLHGDLHQGNILDGDRGWLAIDPLVLCGEAESEYSHAFRGIALLETLYDRCAHAIALAGQINRATGLDSRRLIRWGIARSATELVRLSKHNPRDADQINLHKLVLHALLRSFDAV